MNARAVAVLLVAGVALASDADSGELLLDALVHPSPERRAAALRELRALEGARLFPLLLRHREDERLPVRRAVQRLCMETLLHGTEARRTTLLECLWEQPEGGRDLLAGLESTGRRFPSPNGMLARAVAMRVRQDRAHVRRLAADPASWPLLKRFDAERADALAAVAWVRQRPVAPAPDAVAAFGVDPPQGGLAPLHDALARGVSDLDGLLAALVWSGDARDLALRIALAGTLRGPLPQTREAVAKRLGDAEEEILVAIARGLVGARDVGFEAVARARLEDEGLGDTARAALLLAGTGPDPTEAWAAVIVAESRAGGLSGIVARLLCARDRADREETARRAWEALPGPRERLRILYESTRLGSPVLEPLLVHALREGSDDDRLLLLEQLAVVPRSPGLAAALVAARDGFPSSALARWCDRLVRIDPFLAAPGAAEALLEALAHEDLTVRRAAIESCRWLRRFPPEIVEALTSAVSDDEVCRQLGRVVEGAKARGATAGELLPLLHAVVDTRGSAAGRSGMRRDALCAMARIAPDAAEVRAAFLRGLDGRAVDLRSMAALCFLSVGRLTPREHEALARLARVDPEASPRAVAARVLAWHERPLQPVPAGD